MKFAKTCSAAAGALALAAALPSFAQDYGRWDDADGASRPRSFIPYTSYGYVGANVGQSDYELGGCAPGTSCEGQDTGFKIYTGGQINRIFGVELSYVDLGTVGRNNGDTWARGVNIGALANLPIGPVNVFGKVGGIFAWTNSSSPVAGAPNGKERDFNISYGAGLQYDFNRSWAVRADWDVYRVQFVDGRDHVSLYSIGAVYKY